MRWSDGLDIGDGLGGLGSSLVYLHDTLTCSNEVIPKYFLNNSGNSVTKIFVIIYKSSNLPSLV